MKIYKSYYLHKIYYICMDNKVYKFQGEKFSITKFLPEELNDIRYKLIPITPENNEYTRIENILIKIL